MGEWGKERKITKIMKRWDNMSQIGFVKVAGLAALRQKFHVKKIQSV